MGSVPSISAAASTATAIATATLRNSRTQQQVTSNQEDERSMNDVLVVNIAPENVLIIDSYVNLLSDNVAALAVDDDLYRSSRVNVAYATTLPTPAPQLHRLFFEHSSAEENKQAFPAKPRSRAGSNPASSDMSSMHGATAGYTMIPSRSAADPPTSSFFDKALPVLKIGGAVVGFAAIGYVCYKVLQTLPALQASPAVGTTS